MTLPGCPDYYHRTIEKHHTSLKLVPGSTGLGKTIGIRGMIQALGNQQRTFIYPANRKQLIEDMAQLLDRSGSPLCFICLPRDLETVLGTLKERRSIRNDEELLV